MPRPASKPLRPARQGVRVAAERGSAYWTLLWSIPVLALCAYVFVDTRNAPEFSKPPASTTNVPATREAERLPGSPAGARFRAKIPESTAVAFAWAGCDADPGCGREYSSARTVEEPALQRIGECWWQDENEDALFDEESCSECNGEPLPYHGGYTEDRVDMELVTDAYGSRWVFGRVVTDADALHNLDIRITRVEEVLEQIASAAAGNYGERHFLRLVLETHFWEEVIAHVLEHPVHNGPGFEQILARFGRFWKALGPVPQSLPHLPATGDFLWRIPTFRDLEAKRYHSPIFNVAGYPWRLAIFPKGCASASRLAMLVTPVGSPLHRIDWVRHASFHLQIVNHRSPSRTLLGVGYNFTYTSLSSESAAGGLAALAPLDDILATGSGFLNQRGALEGKPHLRWLQDRNGPQYAGHWGQTPDMLAGQRPMRTEVRAVLRLERVENMSAAAMRRNPSAERRTQLPNAPAGHPRGACGRGARRRALCVLHIVGAAMNSLMDGPIARTALKGLWPRDARVSLGMGLALSNLVSAVLATWEALCPRLFVRMLRVMYGFPEEVPLIRRGLASGLIYQAFAALAVWAGATLRCTLPQLATFFTFAATAWRLVPMPHAREASDAKWRYVAITAAYKALAPPESNVPCSPVGAFFALRPRFLPEALPWVPRPTPHAPQPSALSLLASCMTVLAVAVRPGVWDAVKLGAWAAGLAGGPGFRAGLPNLTSNLPLRMLSVLCLAFPRRLHWYATCVAYGLARLDYLGACVAAVLADLALRSCEPASGLQEAWTDAWRTFLEAGMACADACRDVANDVALLMLPALVWAGGGAGAPGGRVHSKAARASKDQHRSNTGHAVPAALSAKPFKAGRARDALSRAKGRRAANGPAASKPAGPDSKASAEPSEHCTPRAKHGAARPASKVGPRHAATGDRPLSASIADAADAADAAEAAARSLQAAKAPSQAATVPCTEQQTEGQALTESAKVPPAQLQSEKQALAQDSTVPPVDPKPKRQAPAVLAAEPSKKLQGEEVPTLAHDAAAPPQDLPVLATRPVTPQTPVELPQRRPSRDVSAADAPLVASLTALLLDTRPGVGPSNQSLSPDGDVPSAAAQPWKAAGKSRPCKRRPIAKGTPPAGPQVPAQPGPAAPAPAAAGASAALPIAQPASPRTTPAAGSEHGSSEGMCCLCWDAPQETVLAPCGHRALCLACTSRLLAAPQAHLAGVCPVCRARFVSFILREYAV